MARHNAGWWQKLVEEVSRGSDLKAVADRHGVQRGTLRWWQTEFKKRRREGGEAATFLPVVVATSRAKGSDAVREDDGPVDVVVEVGAGRVSLRGGVTAAHVEAIVRGLVGRC